ncbi:MAG: hypothetical protein ABJN42_15985 [Roseibium sp.]|uniref:hypothetical protein n=1 Tax=Roseibium sp. TaxID=1936156 RepID=UPI003296CD64
MAKLGQLLVKWGRPDPGEPADLIYANGAGGAARADAAMASHYFEGIRDVDGKTFKQELEERGYDITTLKFSIQQKKEDTDALF